MATDAEKMMNDYLAAWNSHDVEKLLTFFTDDAVYECTPMGKVSRGKKEIKDFFSSTFGRRVGHERHLCQQQHPWDASYRQELFGARRWNQQVSRR